MKKKREKSNHEADIKGLCFFHANAGDRKCNLVQDFLETETEVQHNPPYSPDLIRLESLCNLSRRRYEYQRSLGSAIFQCLQGVSKTVYYLHPEPGF